MPQLAMVDPNFNVRRVQRTANAPRHAYICGRVTDECAFGRLNRRHTASCRCGESYSDGSLISLSAGVYLNSDGSSWAAIEAE